MRQVLFVMAALLVSMGAYAQEVFKGEHFIEVTGTAETEIDPNEITLNIRLREFEENKSKVALEKIDQDFLNALKAAGIDRKRLTLADAGSRLSKLGKRDKDAFREKTYEVVLTSASELEKFLEKIEPVKVDLIRITRVHNTELEKHKLDLKVKALQVAKSKAETLIRSIGSELGKPLMVREWDQDPVHPMPLEPNVYMKAQANDMALEAEPAMTFRKIRLRSQVSAQFEIK